MRQLTLILAFLAAAIASTAPAGAAGVPPAGAAGYDVLCYHNIVDRLQDDPERFTLSTADLIQHFSWLHENGYTVISIDDLVDAQKGIRPLPPKAVLLTFDDGYRSFYTRVYPLLKQFGYHAVLGVVGSWLQLKPGEQIPNAGFPLTRESFLTREQIREMAASGLVEIASHSYNLHHGLVANPQGNMLPAAQARAYSSASNTYEGDSEYLSRIRVDLAANSELIENLTGKRPRVMVWPYGAYNLAVVGIADSLGMPITLTLNEGRNLATGSLSQIKRVLVSFKTNVADLAYALTVQIKPKPQRVMYVSLDRIYDPDSARQEANLGKLLDRVKAMKVTTVYLQAYADPEGTGTASALYFPNRHMPVRADLFNRVSWQLQDRADVKVFAWMPLLAFDLPSQNALAGHRVMQDDGKTPTGKYLRLTPFDAEVRLLIKDLYEDLSRNSIFDGIVFGEDGTLNDYEDASPWALEHYDREWGLPPSIAEIRGNADLLRKWSEHKARFLTEFSLELANIVRTYQPALKTTRSLLADAILDPGAVGRYAQSLPEYLVNYDYTAIKAMDFSENARSPSAWLRSLVQEVSKQPLALKKSVFELAAVGLRASPPMDSDALASQMRLLQTQGAINFGYLPDDFLNDVPKAAVIRPAFSLQDFPYVRQTEWLE